MLIIIISASDKRNLQLGKAYVGDKWKTIFHDTDSLAKATWSSSVKDKTIEAGLRRYGAAKLCEIMAM